MGHFTQNSSGEIWTVSKYLTKQSVLPNTASLDLSLTVSITFIHLLKTVLFVSFCSFALLEWLTASLGEMTNPDLDLVQMFQLPPPPPWPKHPQCFQGAGLLSSRVTKRPPLEDGGGEGGWLSVCAGGRQDLGMIVWSYLQWGTPDLGIRRTGR